MAVYVLYYSGKISLKGMKILFRFIRNRLDISSHKGRVKAILNNQQELESIVKVKDHWVVINGVDSDIGEQMAFEYFIKGYSLFCITGSLDRTKQLKERLDNERKDKLYLGKFESILMDKRSNMHSEMVFQLNEELSKHSIETIDILVNIPKY